MVDFESIYEEYFPKMYNYMFYKVLNKEIAEDLTSEFFMKLLIKLDTFDETKASMKTWLYSIAHNFIIDYFKSHKIEVSIDDEENPLNLSTDFELERNMIASEDRKMLYDALTKIDERTRKLLSLKYFFYMNNKEISRMTGINESTVSTVILRGIKKIKKMLKK